MSMTRVQLLLAKIAEECSEVAQRALKAQQFGLKEVQSGQSLDNTQRLKSEFSDLLTVAKMLEEETDSIIYRLDWDEENTKREKVEEYIVLSQYLGMVEKE